MASLLGALRSEELVGLPACALCGSKQHMCLQYTDACTVQEAHETSGALSSHMSSASQQVSLSHVSPYFFVLCHTGLIYGAEAHLVTNLTVNGRYHLVVFGKHL